MNAFSPLCTVWYEQVKEFFSMLHGHQSKVLSLFVYGAIQAQSIVVQNVAEELQAECALVKVPSIERRLQRFLANEHVEVSVLWEHLLRQVLPYWQGQPLTLIIDEVAMNDDARVVYIGLLQGYRTLPLMWTVLPVPITQDEQRRQQVVTRMVEQLAGLLSTNECSLMGDSAYGCLWMAQLCQAVDWHFLFRVCGDHTCQRYKHGRLQATCRLDSTIEREGQQWDGAVRLWGEEYETNVSAIWKRGYEEPWFLISDQPASSTRVKEYHRRMRVEATFQDLKSRGYQWEDSHVRLVAHLERLLLVLFLAFWWLTHLGASCIHNGRRQRYDRHDRRDKGVLRLGRLYLRDIARRTPHTASLAECLLFRRRPDGWHFALRF